MRYFLFEVVLHQFCFLNYSEVTEFSITFKAITLVSALITVLLSSYIIELLYYSDTIALVPEPAGMGQVSQFSFCLGLFALKKALHHSLVVQN